MPGTVDDENVPPCKYAKKSKAETRAAAAVSGENGDGVPKATHDDGFHCFDALGEGSERAAALSEAEDVEAEEDEACCAPACGMLLNSTVKKPFAVLLLLF